MPRFDDLPADQKAVLQLLLRQGKSYDDLSTLLRITPEAVRDRALLALDGLGPDDTPGLDDDRRDDIGDFLLGQQSATARAATRGFLESSAPGRAFARVVAGELRPVGGDNLPDIPAEGVEIDEAFDALQARHRHRETREKSSRLGGLLVLGGLAAALALVVILIVSGGDDKDDTPTASTGTNAAATGPTGPQIQEQINMTAGVKGSKARGVVLVLEQEGTRVYAFRADSLGVASPRYAVWLHSEGGKSKFLGFAPPVTGSGEEKGRLTAVTAVPEDAAQYKELVITREQVDKPTKPGLIVLRGPVKAA